MPRTGDAGPGFRTARVGDGAGVFVYRPPMRTILRPCLALLAGLFLPADAMAQGARAQGGTAQGGTAQEPTYLPGSAVGLVPPAGMRVATSFAGFEDPVTRSSILVLDIPIQSYADVLKGFTPDAMAPTGLQASGPPVTWPVTGGEGRLLRGRQVAGGLTFRKWVLLARNPASAAMLSVQLSDLTSASVPDATVEQALRTVVLRTPPGLGDQVSALPFRVGDLAGFRIVRTLSGSGLLLTEGPQDVVAGAAQPMIAIGSGLVGPVDPKGQAALARQGFTTIAGVSDLLPDGDRSYALNGSNWIRTEGRGTYRDTLEAIYVLQIVRFTPTGYLRVVAICRTLDKPFYDARFKALAESVGPK